MTTSFQLSFFRDDLPGGYARVIRLSVRESLSSPFRIEADIATESDDIEPRAWILETGAIVVTAEGEVVRRYAGLIISVREAASRASLGDSRGTTISIVMEPGMSAMRGSGNHRTFQNQTTQDIVSTLLEEAGVEPVEWRLTGTYPQREVCIQLGEPNQRFIHRLLEEEGIFYFSQHDASGETLVFGDSASAFVENSTSHLPFRPASGLASGQAVFALAERRRIRPAKVTLRDHDFKRPDLDLEVAAEGDARLGREYYDYPGRYVEPSEGERRAQVRLDAMRQAAETVSGRGNAYSLAPGHTFTVEQSPGAAFDAEWVVVSVDHAYEMDGDMVRYDNTLSLLPSSTDYRPPSNAPRAVAPGPQLAVVVGPSGEEIHCDEFGRIKVHFHWDRESRMDEQSSCWVRVGQMHSSGSVVIPRVGWEVLVDFEDGDPDRPYVVGRLFNPQSPPPYPLPDKKTVTALKSPSSPGKDGYNEIRMDDAGGSQQVQIYSQKDQNVVVANNMSETVGNDVNQSVGNNHTLTVGGNETVDIGAASTLIVGGAQDWTVGASRTVTVSDNQSSTVKGDRTTNIGGSHTIMTPMSVSYNTPASLTETIGGSVINVAALEISSMAIGAVSTTIGGAKIEACASGKSDMTLGARACTVGGAFVQASGKDVQTGVGGAKATTVGGVWTVSSAGAVTLEAKSTLKMMVGGAVSVNGGKVVMKVGGSVVTLAAGSVVLSSKTVKLTSTGPQPELSAGIEDK